MAHAYENLTKVLSLVDPVHVQTQISFLPITTSYHCTPRIDSATKQFSPSQHRCELTWLKVILMFPGSNVSLL